ncbi:MAG: prepilin-type N-terminal cleavage/methylation domain-containing protein [Prochloraceae cyanobacterium]
MTEPKNPFKFFFQYLLSISWQKQNKGFTLTELLIAVFTSAIVISALLTAMVQILQSDRRENQRTQVQQQVQSALNYINQDLKQAVYVYDTSEVAQYLPDLSAQNATPVLVFWKSKSIPDNQLNYKKTDCANTFNAGTPTAQEQLVRCQNLLLKRTQYVLVAYYQSTNNSNTWKGNSRIIRYELPKFSNTNLNQNNLTQKLQITSGYVDPSEINNDFTNWPINDTGNNLQTANGGRPTANSGQLPVLVDFIDSPDNDYFKETENKDFVDGTNEIETTRLDCSELPRIKDPDNPSQFIDRYERIPPNNNDVSNSENGVIPNFIPFTSNSFYACVRTTNNNNSLVGTKQNVAIYIRGNELTKIEMDRIRNEPIKEKAKVLRNTFLPSVQTQITIGGIIDK